MILVAPPGRSFLCFFEGFALLLHGQMNTSGSPGLYGKYVYNQHSNLVIANYLPLPDNGGEARVPTKSSSCLSVC